MFFEKSCSWKFHKIHGKTPVPEPCNFIKKDTLTQFFSCEFSEIFKNIFFTEHLRTTATELLLKMVGSFFWKKSFSRLRTQINFCLLDELLLIHSGTSNFKVVKKVKRGDSGGYRCTASNLQGTKGSHVVTVDVQCKLISQTFLKISRYYLPVISLYIRSSQSQVNSDICLKFGMFLRMFLL